MAPAHWQIQPPANLPAQFWQAVSRYCAQSNGYFAAQLLWQRGIRDEAQLQAFVDAQAYRPTSPFAFGQEMKWAVQRLHQARETGEKVVIWGDFDADGVTATSVLWEGLGQFFPQGEQLTYYIPHRLRESHGLNLPQLERLAGEGVRLIVTCDTGSTSLREIDQALAWGLDLIITDHHTLPEERPPVVAMINPRYFAENHPLYHLSGVAVAYKLVEALYESFPTIPQQPLSDLLDLVAIGLIADLVQLTGDCRYLAQKGIEQLQKQPQTQSRPGVAKLLEYCKGNGDRPTDISFGIGPRINAISRIHGDASFGVELLTSRQSERCAALAEATELANSRRKSLQKTISAEVEKQVQRLDLSTTGVIVLEDPQWPAGILGLVASKIAQDYGRPTILLCRQLEATGTIVRGSARSIRNIDLYDLLQSQAELLLGFGGHPFAAGLSLPLENLSLFREAINQRFWQTYGDLVALGPQVEVDLTVTVADLGRELFQELKLLEPCGMGNPAPRLLIKGCRFERLWSDQKDWAGRPVMYPKLTFYLKDNSSPEGFPGIWWGHTKEEIDPQQTYDVVVELDFNTYKDKNRYEVRLIDLQVSDPARTPSTDFPPVAVVESPLPPILAPKEHHRREAELPALSPEDILQQLLRLVHQEASWSVETLPATWNLGPVTTPLVLALGKRLRAQPPLPTTELVTDLHQCLEALQEEQFQRQYHCQVILS
ncbi:single-stranded-DNA-specific exonuclease RecJ [Synechocystis sp. LKSZ1]|uniref:single-stranded-DNA-specific exonuclease RecJ n=1 Tax=Synechocystis sp. LKSZ1 TaxID=3144951 RepID=UPI00336BE0AF